MALPRRKEWSGASGSERVSATGFFSGVRQPTRGGPELRRDDVCQPARAVMATGDSRERLTAAEKAPATVWQQVSLQPNPCSLRPLLVNESAGVHVIMWRLVDRVGK